MSMRKARKKHFEPITIKELSRQLRSRAFAKRPDVGRPEVGAPYSETDKLGPADLKRWRKPEKPITILG